jgi:hypothetical protein
MKASGSYGFHLENGPTKKGLFTRNMVEKGITLTAVSGDVFPAPQAERPFMFAQDKGAR